ncbi:tetratricopeptide repeat protein [Actinomadura madurae]|uniref:tetratricopeptide repeat protein n=1 Tax=Actinomadura madurae TaxID=1993 RepID=UPI000D8708F7|nr:tetratricopeptide repeat protein [Actinomadura madurae]SPT49925.1 Regulatory protein AfsR [Actinomadura madurae]
MASDSKGGKKWPSVIDGWFKGPSVPGADSTASFLRMVEQLRTKVGEDADYRALTEAEWTHLLTQAQQESKKRQTGRPPADRRPVTETPMTLPVRPTAFTGRQDMLQNLLGRLDPDRSPHDMVVVSTVAGMGGVGKSALAIHAAHGARDRRWFPGGLLHLNLHGYDPRHGPADAETVVDRLLTDLGIKTRDLPPDLDGKHRLWQQTLARLADQHRPVLVLLDNVASSSQVMPLRPPTPHRMLVTSRQKLSDLRAYRIELPPMAEPEAVQLLDAALRVTNDSDDRVQRDLQASRDDDDGQAHRIAALCGYLPLALWIVAGLLSDEPLRPLADLADELQEAHTRLDALGYPGIDEEGRPLAVRAAMDLSYRRLDPQQQRAFRLMAFAPGHDISTDSATALLDGDRFDARRLLADLARGHLLEAPAFDRWSMHDLIRLYGAEHSAAHSAADHRDQALARLIQHYLRLTRERDARLTAPVTSSSDPEPRSSAFADLDIEYLNLTATAFSAVDDHYDQVRDLALYLGAYLKARRQFGIWIDLSERILQATRDRKDRAAESKVLCALGVALEGARRYPEAVEAHRRDLRLSRELADHAGERTALNNLGSALRGARRLHEGIEATREALNLSRSQGDTDGEVRALINGAGIQDEARRFDDAARSLRRALTIIRSANGDLEAEMVALSTLGIVLQRTEQFEESIDVLNEAITACRRLGDRHGEAANLSHLGIALGRTGETETAITTYRKAIAITRDIDDPHSEAQNLTNLGICLDVAGRPEEAVPVLRRAIALYEESGDPHEQAMVLDALGNALEAAGRPEESLATLTRAVAAFQALNDQYQEATSLTNLSAVQAGLDRYSDAIDTCKQAITIFQVLDDLDSEVQARRNLRIIKKLAKRERKGLVRRRWFGS